MKQEPISDRPFGTRFEWLEPDAEGEGRTEGRISADKAEKAAGGIFWGRTAQRKMTGGGKKGEPV